MTHTHTTCKYHLLFLGQRGLKRELKNIVHYVWLKCDTWASRAPAARVICPQLESGAWSFAPLIEVPTFCKLLMWNPTAKDEKIKSLSHQVRNYAKKECKGQASFRQCSQFDSHGMTRGNIANEELYGRLFAVYRILLNHWLLNYAELQFDAGWIRMNRSCPMSLPIMRCIICAHAPAAPPSSFALLWKSFPFAIYVINIYIYIYVYLFFQNKTRIWTDLHKLL